MSLLDHDGCDPNHAADMRVRYNTSQNVIAFWDRMKAGERRDVMLAELAGILESDPRPGESVSELIVRAAQRIAFREEHG